MIIDRPVNQRETRIGEGNDHAAPILRVAAALDQSGLLQPVNAVGHGSRRHHCAVHQSGRAQAEWRAGPSERRQHIKGGRVQPMGGIDLVQSPRQMVMQPFQPADDPHWRNIQIGPFSPPLFQNIRHMIHAGQYGTKVS